MEQAAAGTTESAANGTPAAEGRLRARLKLPAVKLPRMPRLGVRPLLPAIGLRRPGRPALADLVFAAGAASLVLSVLFVINAPARARLRARADEAAVVANAATLQLSTETFAAANGGRYPRDVRELLPYLPEGAAPRNPYSGEPTSFRGLAGDLTYRPTAGGGYVIEAWGAGAARPRRLAALRGTATTVAH